VTTPPVAPAQKDQFSVGTAKVTLSSLGGTPISWEMEKYQKSEVREPIDMVSPGVSTPLSTTFTAANVTLPAVIPFRVAAKTDTSIRYEWSSPEVTVVKTYTFFPDKYSADVSIQMINRTAHPVQASPVVAWTAVQAKQSGGFLHSLQGPPNVWTPLFDLGGAVTRETDLNQLSVPEASNGLMWAGVENRYFISAIIPRANVGSKTYLKTLPAPADMASAAESGVVLPEMVIPAGGSETRLATLYVGPKEVALLRSMNVGLERAIDYGWFSAIAVPILWLLQWFYTVLHNYGLAIIGLTLLVKLLMHPLTKKSLKSMKAMKDLQPKIAALKEKYGKDRERMNVEMMQLFKTNNVNPLSGCLPMLLQMPIYIALYKVLWNAIELYRAPFFAWYHDLSAPDPYFIGPILLGIFMFLQQKLTPTATVDPAQQKMMMFMPIMFTAFMLFLPSGLVLYILVNTVMGVIQQWMMTRGIGWRDVLRGRLSPASS
jgi:YidC/Oxa1 family membrane protein insertase